MMGFKESSHINNNSSSNFQVDYESGDGSIKSLRKAYISRFPIANKIPILKKTFIDKSQEMNKSINQSSSFGLFETTQLKSKDANSNRFIKLLRETSYIDKCSLKKRENINNQIIGKLSKSQIFEYERDNQINKQKCEMKYDKNPLDMKKNQLAFNEKPNFKYSLRQNNNFNDFPFKLTQKPLHSNSIIHLKSKKMPICGFKSYSVPRITTLLKKSASELLSKNPITNYYKNMEISLKTGEKQFGNIDFKTNHDYDNIKGICEISNKKISDILNSEMIKFSKHSSDLPKIKDFILKKPVMKISIRNGGTGKHMGFKYNPYEFFYPIHISKERNKYGQPYMN